MKKNFFLTILLGLLFFSCTKQKLEISSEYLINPEKNIPFAVQSAEFWFDSQDKDKGGFFTFVQENGQVDPENRMKTVLTQSRHAYGFARAFQLSGDVRFLDAARSALDFQYEHFWDKKNGGWHVAADENGALVEHWTNENKWSFMQHYALLGIAAMYDASRQAIDRSFLEKGVAVLDEKMWDSREKYYGFFSNCDLDWSNPQGKGFTPTADCITTNGLSWYLINQTEQNLDRLCKVADGLSDHLVPSMAQCNFSFAEAYDNDWNIDKSKSHVSVGHTLKASWCLGRTFLLKQDPKYKKAGITLIEEILEKGYDPELGAPWSDFNAFTGEMKDRNRNWWQMEQAVTAGLIQYYITGKKEYLEMADKSSAFFMKYFVDPKHGEVYGFTDEKGNVIKSRNKGDFWKAAYHSIEQAYYTYLYSQLYLHKKPAFLYYRFPAKTEEYTVSLYPIAMEKYKLKIATVEKDGKAYSFFNRDTRSILIKKDQGGIFKVAFIRKD